jgi:hypothetical protein
VKTIEYKVIYAEGEDEIVRVLARDINSGMTKALKAAKVALGNGVVRELHSIQFWMVK